MNKFLEIRMSVAAVIDCVVNGIDSAANEKKCHDILLYARYFRYDEKRPLFKNIRSYYKQRGFESFEALCVEVEENIAKWKALGIFDSIDIGMVIISLAIAKNIPLFLDIEVNSFPNNFY